MRKINQTVQLEIVEGKKEKRNLDKRKHRREPDPLGYRALVTSSEETQAAGS